MRIIRLIGWIFILGAIICLGLDLNAYFSTGNWRPLLLGRLWNEWHPASLQLLQPAIERHLWAPLWGDIVFPILLKPASLVFFILSLIFLLIGRRRGNPNTIRRRRRY